MLITHLIINTPMPPSLLAQCGVVTRGQEYDNQLGRQLIMPPSAWCLITSPRPPSSACIDPDLSVAVNCILRWILQS